MENKIDLLVQIARLYYHEDKTQGEIAAICQVERSQVSRLLAQAREMGVVQFRVVDPSHSDQTLVTKLQQRFKLQHALVCDSFQTPDSVLKRTLGLVAANYLKSVLKEGDVLAVSWGETIYHTVLNLRHGPARESARNLVVVPAVGGAGLLTVAYQVNELVRQVAERLGGSYTSLYAPAFVESAEARAGFMDSKDIQAVVDLWDQVTVAIVGIGKSPFAYQPEPAGNLQFGEFYLHSEEIQELKNRGVVGDINARFFDAQGQEQYLKIHQRTVGMSLTKLGRVPLVIGVAGGPGKIEAIRGALRGNHLDVLITDQWTAQHLMEDSVQ